MYIRSLRGKLRMRWVFDVSKVKESSFLNWTSLTPLRFLMLIFWKISVKALWYYSLFERIRLKRKNDVYSH